MAKLNTKSDIYYVDRVAYFAPLHIMKAYIIDDDCGEFIVTLAQDYIGKGYQATADFNIIDCKPYRSEDWQKIADDARWCPQLVIY